MRSSVIHDRTKEPVVSAFKSEISTRSRFRPHVGLMTVILLGFSAVLIIQFTDGCDDEDQAKQPPKGRVYVGDLVSWTHDRPGLVSSHAITGMGRRPFWRWRIDAIDGPGAREFAVQRDDFGDGGFDPARCDLMDEMLVETVAETGQVVWIRVVSDKTADRRSGRCPVGAELAVSREAYLTASDAQLGRSYAGWDDIDDCTILEGRRYDLRETLPDEGAHVPLAAFDGRSRRGTCRLPHDTDATFDDVLYHYERTTWVLGRVAGDREFPRSRSWSEEPKDGDCAAGTLFFLPLSDAAEAIHCLGSYTGQMPSPGIYHLREE